MSNNLEGRLKYKDLEFPTFVNSHEVAELTAHGENGKEMRISVPFFDIPKAAVLAGTPVLSIGDTRCGKSQLMMDVHRNFFGGDSDSGGNSNWNVARNDFNADNYFMTIDQEKVGKGKGLLSEARVPVKRRVEALCNHLDELNLAIPEVQVEFFGMPEGRHKDMELGRGGYHMSMASCNMNRVNGDFAGTSEINRALLNRFPITLDFDFYRRTDADEDVLASREASGTIKLASIRDISDKLLNANGEIRKASSERDPWLDAYLRVLSSGLDYCDIDSDKRKKRIWPSKCGSCDYESNDLCKLVKGPTRGTIEGMKRFAHGLDYLMNLKHGQVNIDPFDLALTSFLFTTYHGNLNGVEVRSAYAGEDQEQMRDVEKGLRQRLEVIKPYIDLSIEHAYRTCSAETRFISVKGLEDSVTIYSEDTKSQLDESIKNLEKAGKTISYHVFDPFEDQKYNAFGESGGSQMSFTKSTGIRMDWFKGYVESVAEHYKEVNKAASLNEP